MRSRNWSEAGERTSPLTRTVRPRLGMKMRSPDSRSMSSSGAEARTPGSDSTVMRPTPWALRSSDAKERASAIFPALIFASSASRAAPMASSTSRACARKRASSARRSLSRLKIVP